MQSTHGDSLHSTPAPTEVTLPDMKSVLAKGETGMTMRCQNNSLTACTVHNEAGNILFTVDSPGFLLSFSWRRHVRDASGRHLFDFRRSIQFPGYTTGWVINSPNGEELAKIRHNKSVWNSQRSSVNIEILKTGDLIEMRHVDSTAAKIIVRIGGETVADIVALENNDMTSWLTRKVRSVWKAQIASGVDLYIILIAMLCRAEQRISWWQ